MRIKSPLIFIVIALITVSSFSQIIRNDKYLTDIVECKLTIAKEMKMANKSQLYYEGSFQIVMNESDKELRLKLLFDTNNNVLIK